MTGVEYVRQFCKDNGIPISKVEKDLGFGNGYFNPKKLKKIPMEKAILIADYLQCSLDALLMDGVKRPIVIKRPEIKKAIDQVVSGNNGEYHYDQESHDIARQILLDEDLHALFDAARGCKPEDLKMARDLLKRLKETNHDG